MWSVPAGMALVGSNSIQPAWQAAPGAHPGVHGVRPFQARLARGRVGAQEARDVAGGDADAAQAGDHHLGEVLADAVAAGEGLGRGRVDGGGVGIEVHVAVQREADGAHGVERGHAGDDLLAGVGGHLGGRRGARARAEEMVRGVGVEAAVVGDLGGEAGEVGRDVELWGVGDALDPRGDAEEDLVVLGAEGDLDGGVAEEVDQRPALGRPGLDGEQAGDPALDAGEIGRQQAQDVPPGDGGAVVVVGDGAADVVDHASAGRCRR